MCFITPVIGFDFAFPTFSLCSIWGMSQGMIEQRMRDCTAISDAGKVDKKLISLLCVVIVS